jgi:hypothetical protein
MAKGRAAKRARKKGRRHERRAEWRSIAQRRRRQRRIAIALTSVILIGVGGALAFAARPRKPESTKPSPTPQSPGVIAPKLTPVACGAKLPPAAGSSKKAYGLPSDQHLDAKKHYVVHMQTSCGAVDIALDVVHSPKTSNSVAFLVNEHFYDGLVFHRNGPVSAG